MKSFKEYLVEATEDSLKKKIETKQNQLEVAREKRRASGKSKGVQSEREVKLGAEISRLRQELHALQLQKNESVNEEIKGWKHAHSDMMKIRKGASDASKEVKLVKLKKDGSESKMHDAAKMFSSEAEARAHHENIKKLNPGRSIMHSLYVGGEHKEKLS